MTIWLGIGTTLYPLDGPSTSSPASRHRRAEAVDVRASRRRVTRPLVEFDQLRWQRVKRAETRASARSLWRRQDPKERDAESAAGTRVVREGRILPGIGREFMPPLDEGSFLYMPSLLPQAGLGPAHRSQRQAGPGHRQRAGGRVGRRARLGRAESALDPAPIGMMESIIILKPEAEWRHDAGEALVLRLAGLAEEAARLDLARAPAHHEERNPHRASGEDRDSRRAADLPATDPDAPRHAADRLPRHDGREDLRQRPEGNRAHRPADRAAAQARCPARPTSSPTASSASRIWNSKSTATASPATASTSATCRMSSRSPSAA